jgi:hypothetical protein
MKVDNLSSADDLQLPLGMEAPRANATNLHNLESDHDIASCKPTIAMHNVWNSTESNPTLITLEVGS